MTLGPSSITFFTGPMACGKTLELVRHLQIFSLQQIPLVCLRPSLDTRTSQVASRAGLLHEAISVDPHDLDGIRKHMSSATVIGIDEIQMFDANLIPLMIEQLALQKILLVSGIDTDFRAQPFASVQALMALPEVDVQRLKAVCAVCHQFNATRTQRLRHGQPVSFADPVLLVEGSAEDVTYEARCVLHHQIKP